MDIEYQISSHRDSSATTYDTAQTSHCNEHTQRYPITTTNVALCLRFLDPAEGAEKKGHVQSEPPLLLDTRQSVPWRACSGLGWGLLYYWGLRLITGH